MNIVVLIGRVTKDIDLRYIDGTDGCYCRFTLAVDKDLSKEKREEAKSNGKATADFINVVAFGKIAENCNKFLSKGKNVAINGSVQTGSYIASDGVKKYFTEVLAKKVQFIDFKEKEAFNNFDDGLVYPYEEEENEDIPF